MERQERYYTRGYIPHWDKPGATQFVTWRLWDSLPDGVLRRLENECPASNHELRKRRELTYFNLAQVLAGTA